MVKHIYTSMFLNFCKENVEKDDFIFNKEYIFYYTSSFLPYKNKIRNRILA